MEVSPSRKAGYVRRSLYKQSPAKSPLRDVLKARCKERMQADRDNVVNGRRKMEMEAFMRKMVREEATAWRNEMRQLSFGQSNIDVEEAINELEEIEEELLAESVGLPLQQVWDEDFLTNLASAIVCPVCQVGRCGEEGSRVFCYNPGCNLQQLVVPGGLVALGRQLEQVVEAHGSGGGCGSTLVFGSTSDCLLAVCNQCEFLYTVGGI